MRALSNNRSAAKVIDGYYFVLSLSSYPLFRFLPRLSPSRFSNLPPPTRSSVLNYLLTPANLLAAELWSALNELLREHHKLEYSALSDAMWVNALPRAATPRLNCPNGMRRAELKMSSSRDFTAAEYSATTTTTAFAHEGWRNTVIRSGLCESFRANISRWARKQPRHVFVYVQHTHVHLSPLDTFGWN